MIFCVFNRNSNSGRNGGDNGGDNDDADEEPPDFTNLLDEIERLLHDYDGEFNNTFMPAANDILQTHHNHLNSGGYHGTILPPVSREQWDALFISIRLLEAYDTRLRILFDEIRNSPRFVNISPDQRRELLGLTNLRTQLINDMQRFYLDFLDRYDNGLEPR